MTQKNKALLLILLAALLGAGIAPFSKLALKQLPSAQFNLLRFLVAALVLVPWFVYKKHRLFWQDIKSLFLVSLLAVANTTLFIFALRYTSASNSQILYAAVPLVVASVSYFSIGERFPKLKLLGLLVGFVGLVFVIVSPLADAQPFSRQSLLGNVMIVLGIVAFSFYSVLSKKLQTRYSPFILTFSFVLSTILVQLILLPFLPGSWHLPSSLSLTTALCVFYVGALGMALHYLVYQKAINIATPTVASAMLYLQPIFAVILASFLLGERLTWSLFLGGLVVFAGVAMLGYSK